MKSRHKKLALIGGALAIVGIIAALVLNALNSNIALYISPTDVADGKAVRLTQGEAGSETDYGNPVEAAMTWVNAGAEWIHLVDLDAAFGRGDNRSIIGIPGPSVSITAITLPLSVNSTRPPSGCRR